MNDPRNPDPRPVDPAYEARSHMQPPHTDPALDPILSDQHVNSTGSGRGGLVAAGVIAVLLVIAVIAFSSGTVTDPGTTAVIPDQTQETMPAPGTQPAPAPEVAPTQPTPSETAPSDTMPAPNNQ